MLVLSIQDSVNDEVFAIEVEETGCIEDIKVLISVEKNIPVEQIILLHNSKILQNDFAKIQQSGINHYDLIIFSTQAALRGAAQQLRPQQQQMRPQQQQQQFQAQPQVNQNDASLLNNFFTDLSKQNIQVPASARRQAGPANFNNMFNNSMAHQVQLEIQKLKQHYLNNPQELHYILNQDPELGNAIAAEDQLLMEQIVSKRLNEQMQRKRAEMERQQRLFNADPNDIEAQKEIDEMIRKNLVEQNYQLAQENFPEFFGQITMLYISAKVNGKEIQAFVDSGAQSTIISKQLAEKVGLMRLIDTRFAGMAMGVGTSKILGRIHAADMEILGKKFTCSFTVLEDNKVEFLFGLDNLKRHQCNIDLVQNMLHMRNGEVSVPFLSEGEIKKNEFEEEKQALIDRQKSLGSKYKESDIKELMEIGFDENQVLEAMSICDGNKEHAATYLMGLSMSRQNSSPGAKR